MTFSISFSCVLISLLLSLLASAKGNACDDPSHACGLTLGETFAGPSNHLAPGGRLFYQLPIDIEQAVNNDPEYDLWNDPDDIAYVIFRIKKTSGLPSAFMKVGLTGAWPQGNDDSDFIVSDESSSLPLKDMLHLDGGRTSEDYKTGKLFLRVVIKNSEAAPPAT